MISKVVGTECMYHEAEENVPCHIKWPSFQEQGHYYLEKSTKSIRKGSLCLHMQWSYVVQSVDVPVPMCSYRQAVKRMARGHRGEYENCVAQCSLLHHSSEKVQIR